MKTMLKKQTIQKPEVKTGIPGSTIKIIAIITMFIDHFAATILDNYLMFLGADTFDGGDAAAYQEFADKYGLLIEVDSIMRLIGRLGFPLFVFLLVEGFTHTRNVIKYGRNLLIFALLSEIPFDLAFNGKILEFAYQNVFFTLFLGVAALFCIKKLTDIKDYKNVFFRLFQYLGPVFAGLLAAQLWYNSMGSACFGLLGEAFNMTGWDKLSSLAVGVVVIILYAVFMLKKEKQDRPGLALAAATTFAICILADFLKTDYSGWGVFTVVMVYLFRADRIKAMRRGALALFIMKFNEITAFFALIPIAKYNGERGLKLKYFFYIFYPAHLLLLYLICVLMGTV